MLDCAIPFAYRCLVRCVRSFGLFSSVIGRDVEVEHVLSP
jgi:hypothetical protein